MEEASAVPADDVLDAAAAVWSARRIGAGELVHLPAESSEVDGPREIAIWA